MNYLDKTGLTYLCSKIKELIPKTASEVGALAADGTAAKATADADGNNIASTYATKTEVAAKADKSAVDTHTADTSNPHSVTKAQVGLGNVDNTADLDKPISTATQTALNLKANNTDIILNDSNTSSGIINKAGWYRLASFKGSSNNSTRGSSCNSCEIVIQRAFGNINNEYHHLYFISTFLSHKFCSIVNQSNYHLFDKIRYVEETDDNGIITAYIDIHTSITSANDFSYKILNSKTRNTSWKCSFEYLGNNDDIDGQVVYDIPANSELVQKEAILFNGSCVVESDGTGSVMLTKSYTNYKSIGIDVINNNDCKPRIIIDIDNTSFKTQFEGTGINLDYVLCVGNGSNVINFSQATGNTEIVRIVGIE